ncbi:hypothetical protein ACSBR2_019632 [Camellia fascicularis]
MKMEEWHFHFDAFYALPFRSIGVEDMWHLPTRLEHFHFDAFYALPFRSIGVEHSLVAVVPDSHEDLHDEIYDREDHPNGDNDTLAEENMQVDFTKLTERQKKMFELRLKTNEARKANQTAMVAEKKRMEAPPESKGVSKEKWIEERKKKIGKLLDANGLDMTRAYMLKTLYNAYKKRSKNIEIDVEEYNKMKEADPDFYREASSLQYGKASAPKVAEDKIERMVKELKDRDEKQEEKIS